MFTKAHSLKGFWKLINQLFFQSSFLAVNKNYEHLTLNLAFVLLTLEIPMIEDLEKVISSQNNLGCGSYLPKPEVSKFFYTGPDSK